MNGLAKSALLALGVLALFVPAGLLGACGDEAPSGSDPALKGSITVFAASSLTDAFREAGRQFETANPGVHVTFNFGGSSALVTQINEGQPGDVFAAADTTNMELVTGKSGTGAPATFATNFPVVVVPSTGSPVRSFEDLGKPGIKLVLAAPAVPIGSYAREVLANASASGGISADFTQRVLANLKSNETDVKAVLAKIQTGEADAGIVYATDAAAAGNGVKVIAVPSAFTVVARYPIAVLRQSEHAAVAKAFVDFVLSAQGQAILQKYGFGKP